VRSFWCDASVILRLLTGEPERLARRAVDIFRDAERGAYVLRVHPVTVAEVVYTLKSYYRIPQDQASDALLALLERDGVELVEEQAMCEALRELPGTGAGFADVLLACLAAQQGDGVATFDRDFYRLGADVLGDDLAHDNG